MKKTIASTICIALIAIFSMYGSSCSDNKTGNKTSTADTTTANQPKMSAKERLAKNNILEKHLNWGSKKLKGKVKSVVRTTYGVDDKGSKIFESKEVDNFDTNGNLVAYGGLSEQGKTIYTNSILYDAGNNDTAMITSHPDGKITGRGAISYDNRGNETEQVYHDADGKTLHKVEYKYDDKDNLTEVDFFSERGTSGQKYTYTYDENGCKTSCITYDSTGKNMGRVTYSYDNKGNIVSNIVYFDNATIVEKDSFKYDGKGNEIEYDTYQNKDSLISKKTMLYDDHGSGVSYVVKNAGGNIDEKSSFSEDYEYDATGNITKKSAYKKKEGKKVLISMTEYAITYY